jgi:hypothetical protein
MPYVARSLVSLFPKHLKFQSYRSLRKFLLDEEGAQMRKLPCASDTENDELNHGPSNDAGVCVFGLVAELGFAFLRGY